jgi:large conductance mechanosensitive channel
MGFLKDFKTFAMKGNLADLAIGVVIGAAFGKVIAAFVDGLVLPLVGTLFQSDFSSLYISLSDSLTKENSRLVADGKSILSLVDARKMGPVFAYGDFISTTINFLIIALVCYLVIKNLLRKDPNAVAPPSATESLLAEIRDSLKK